MKLKLPAGQTSVMLPIFVRDTSSSTGAGLGLLTSATSGLVGEYRRRGSSSWTPITLTSATLGTFTSGGWVADGSLAGSYEVGIPDLAIATGARWVAIRFYGAANMAPVLIELELDSVNYQDATRFGLGALPNNNAEASGGLITRGSGTGQMLVLSGQVSVPSVNVASGGITSASFGTNALGAVWDEARSSHTTSGTFGAYVLANTAADASIAPASTALTTATWTGTRAGYLDNLSAGAVATASSLTTVGTNVSSILTQTGTTGVAVASGAITSSTFGAGAITATAIASDAITAAKIAAGAIDADALAADAVTEIWSVSVPGAFASGTAAYVLGNVATGTPPTAAAIADAVWDEARAGHTTTGTFGAYVLAKADGDASIAPASTALSTATWTGTRAGYLDNLSAGAVSTASALSSVASNVTSILGQTGTTGVVVATVNDKTGYSLATSPPTAAAIASAVLTTQMTESYAADGTAPTLAQAVFLIQQGVTEFSISGTTVTLKKINKSTTAATYTLDSSTTPTSRTRAS